jgi:hypothetical protein
LITAAKDDSIRITPINSLDFGSAVSIGTESEAIDLVASKKTPKLLFAVNTSAILSIRDGKIVSKVAVKYAPSSIALSVDETLLVVGGAV